MVELNRRSDPGPGSRRDDEEGGFLPYQIYRDDGYNDLEIHPRRALPGL